jgi:hypothetical protein
MISDEVNTLPTKSRSLRAKSIAKRLATEKNQSEVTTKVSKRSSSSSSKHHTMSKYRRKVANAKERDRMKLVSEAFDKLSNVVPVYKMMTTNTVVVPEYEDEDTNNADTKNPVTKVSTLRCAIAYINSLQRLIEDSNRGVLDPSLYSLEADEENDVENNFVTTTTTTTTATTTTEKKKKKKSDSKAKKANKKTTDSKSKKAKESAKKKFKVRQYHASDFSPRRTASGKVKKATTAQNILARPMSKAQLNLAIAKGLQNCKPIYTPPPPASKKTQINLPLIQPLQLIQLRPLNMTCEISDDTSSLQSDSSMDYLIPSLEIFLQQPSPTSSSTSSSPSSMMASSPLSSTSTSVGDCLSSILEPHGNILDDIQAVLMDADNFDILV